MVSIIYSAHLTVLFKPQTAEGANPGIRVDYLADTLKVALMDVNHVAVHTNTYWSEISVNELPPAGGYADDGKTLSSKTVINHTGNGEGQFDAADIQWTGADFTANHAVLWKDDGIAHSSSPVLASWDFGGGKSVSGGTFKIQWGTDGILNFTSP